MLALKKTLESKVMSSSLWEDYIYIYSDGKALELSSLWNL
jgi:hypothetical protein